MRQKPPPISEDIYKELRLFAAYAAMENGVRKRHQLQSKSHEFQTTSGKTITVLSADLLNPDAVIEYEGCIYKIPALIIVGEKTKKLRELSTSQRQNKPTSTQIKTALDKTSQQTPEGLGDNFATEAARAMAMEKEIRASAPAALTQFFLDNTLETITIDGEAHQYRRMEKLTTVEEYILKIIDDTQRKQHYQSIQVQLLNFANQLLAADYAWTDLKPGQLLVDTQGNLQIIDWEDGMGEKGQDPGAPGTKSYFTAATSTLQTQPHLWAEAQFMDNLAATLDELEGLANTGSTPNPRYDCRKSTTFAAKRQALPAMLAINAAIKQLTPRALRILERTPNTTGTVKILEYCKTILSPKTAADLSIQPKHDKTLKSYLNSPSAAPLSEEYLCRIQENPAIEIVIALAAMKRTMQDPDLTDSKKINTVKTALKPESTVMKAANRRRGSIFQRVFSHLGQFLKNLTQLRSYGNPFKETYQTKTHARLFTLRHEQLETTNTPTAA